MAEALHISQNAYSLIENGITRLVDNERIKLIAEKLGVKPIKLGLFEDFGIEEQSGNNEMVLSLKKELEIKNSQIEKLLDQNKQLLSQVLSK